MKKISILVTVFLLISIFMCLPVSAAGISEDIEKMYELESGVTTTDYTETSGYISTQFYNKLETEIEVKEKYNYPVGYNYYSIIKGTKTTVLIYSKEKITFTKYSGSYSSLIPDKQDEIIVIPFSSYEKTEQFLKGHFTSAECFKEIIKPNEYSHLIYSIDYQSTIYTTNKILNEEKKLEDYRDTRETKTIGGLTASQIFNGLSNEFFSLIPLLLSAIVIYISIRKGWNFIKYILRGV